MSRMMKISLIITVLAAFVSYFLKQPLAQTIRYAIYDFFLLELFQMTYAGYKASASKISLALNNKQTMDLVSALVSYFGDGHSEIVNLIIGREIDKLAQMLINTSNTRAIEVDLKLIITMSQSSARFAQQIDLFCAYDEIKILKSLDFSKCKNVVVYYWNYAELVQSEEELRSILPNFDSVKFYRLQKDITVSSYCIFNNECVIDFCRPKYNGVLYLEKDIESYIV